MIKDAINLLIDKGSKEQKFIKVHDDGDSVQMLVLEDGKYHLKMFEKPAVKRGHLFASLDSFIEYLNGPKCEKGGVCFVSNDEVVAELNYNSHVSVRVLLTLKESPEFTALKLLSKGVNQKDLWRALVTDLKGNFPDELELAVGNAKAVQKTESQVEINDFGLVKGETSDSITVTFMRAGGNEMETVVLKKEWSWIGRLWEAVPVDIVKAEFLTRLELSAEGGLIKYTFHIPEEDTVKLQAKEDLTAHLRKKINGKFEIYVGTQG